MKNVLIILCSILFSNVLWIGLWYGNVLPNRMTSTQYIHYAGERTIPPAVSINGYPAESDFDAVMADELLKLKFKGN